MRPSSLRWSVTALLLAALYSTATSPWAPAPADASPDRPAPAATATPVVEVSPATGHAGARITVTGAGFPRNTHGTLSFGTTSMRIRAAVGGNFSTTVTVPSGPAGPLDVLASFPTAQAGTSFERTAEEASMPREPISRTFRWKGREWTTRSFQGAPAPHHGWDGGTDNIWVDEQDRLRLKITRSGGQLIGAQLWTGSLGYGTYRWNVASRLDELHPSVVFGLWTYDDDTPVPGHREIDIEFTRWGNPTYWNAWYNVHPQEVTNASSGFFLGSQTDTTHEWTWEPGSVTFRSRDAAGRLLGEHVYTSATLVPEPATEKVLMNLWVIALGDWQSVPETEILVNDFTFTPLAP